MTSTFLPYHEPTTVQLLTLASFLVFLPTLHHVFQKVFSAGLLGPLFLGIIYGVPLSNILVLEWQEAFLALGYLGLILVVFEGGLSTRIDLLWQNAALSLVSALVGIGTPMALSFALLSAGFKYPLVEAFVIGAALSATSLGTTFAIIGALGQTRVGTIIMSAAMLDDVVGLIMASVVTSLGQSSNGDSSLGWSIGQPVLAAVLLTLFVPVAAKFVIGPVYRRFLHGPLNKRAPYGQTLMILLVLAALCSIAAYAGTSILYGAYLAGTVLAYLDVMIKEVVGRDLVSSSSVPSASATFASMYDRLFGPVHHNLLEPLFFASVGFAIPFRDAWRGHLIWRGIVYSLLMVAGKVVVGLCIPLWTALPTAYRSVRVQLRKPQPQEHVPIRLESPSIGDVWSPALILGSAMVARGEIGLLILQLGYAQSGHLSDEGFIVGTWAVVLNTLIGPLAVGALMRRFGERVIAGPWGKSL